MKILHLIDSGGLYGAEKMLLELVREQIKSGLSPLILSAGEHQFTEKPLEAEAKRLGLPLLKWRMNPGFNIRESRKILQWARTNSYDLIHSHGFKFNVLIGSYPIAIRKIPMIATLHGYVHAKKFSRIWFYEMLDRYAVTFMQGVVLVGNAMNRELPSRLVGSDKVIVIQNGLDYRTILSKSNQKIESEIQNFIENHSPVILGVGRLSEEKGFDRLVEAIKTVSVEYDNLGLIIVGEGKQKGNLETRIKEYGVQDKVLLPGYNGNVPALQRRSDLLVIPSLTEGLPITLLEAMAVGVPVLASPVGEMPSVLGGGEGGWLLPEDFDGKELGRSIIRALQDPERKKKVVWASRTIATCYSAEAMEDKYRKLYRTTLGEIA